MRTWRFIDSGAASGRRNMEIDRSLFENFVPGESMPVLRFYEWDPPAISAGRFQEPADVADPAKCASLGIDIVRRITGGGALLHEKELTYSIVCAVDDTGCAGVRESYRRLCSFLLETYKKLGLAAGFAEDITSMPNPGRSAFCWGSWEKEDILVNGLKLGGNAQRRSRGKIFQHGSVPITADPCKLRYLFNIPADCTRAGWLGMFTDVTSSRLKELLLDSFREQMGACFSSE